MKNRVKKSLNFDFHKKIKNVDIGIYIIVPRIKYYVTGSNSDGLNKLHKISTQNFRVS